MIGIAMAALLTVIFLAAVGSLYARWKCVRVRGFVKRLRLEAMADLLVAVQCWGFSVYLSVVLIFGDMDRFWRAAAVVLTILMVVAACYASRTAHLSYKILEYRRILRERGWVEKDPITDPSTIESIVDEVIEDVKNYFRRHGEYPSEVSLLRHEVTDSVAKSAKCSTALDAALRELKDAFYDRVELRAPRPVGVDVSPRDAWAANETVFVYFKTK